MTDETGNVYGRLIVLSQSGRNTQGAVRWLCRCECGELTRVVGAHLRNKTIRSCGCLHKDYLLNRSDLRQEANFRNRLRSQRDVQCPQCGREFTQNYQRFLADYRPICCSRQCAVRLGKGLAPQPGMQFASS